MKLKIYIFCFLMLFLTACTHAVNKDTKKEVKGNMDKSIKITTTTEEVASEKNSNNKNTSIPTTELEKSSFSESINPIDSDTVIKLKFNKDSKISYLKFNLGMSYDDVQKTLNSIGENMDKTPWDTYSNYTIIDKRRLWDEMKTQDDYYKYASNENFIINENMEYTFIFISNSNSNILACLLCDNSNVETNKHIKCGDSLEQLFDIYGNNYLFYDTEKYIIYEYKTNNGYLRFFVNPKTSLISSWGIDIFSFKDGIEENKVYDRIFSGKVSTPESPQDLTQSSQIANDCKESSEGEASGSIEHKSSNITQEEALNIVKDKLQPLFRQGDYIIFDNSQIKGDNDYYVFRYYNKSGTLAWFYVNQNDGSCYVLDIMAKENDLIEYHSGDIYW